MPDRIRIYFERAKHHRVIHCDQARGGITQHNCVHIGLVSEMTDFSWYSSARELDADGQIGKVIDRSGYEEEVIIRREIEADVILSRSAAERLVVVLQGCLDALGQDDSQDDGTDESEKEGQS